MKKNIIFFVSLISITVSFFLGYLFWSEKFESQYLKEKEKNYQVNLVIKKTKMNVIKNSDKIRILINWNESGTGETSLEK